MPIKRKAVDPFRRRGRRGVTARAIRFEATRFKVFRQLLLARALSARDVRELAKPFSVRSLLRDTERFGISPRPGRAGGYEVLNESWFRDCVDRHAQTLAAYRNPEIQTIIREHLAGMAEPAPTVSTNAARAARIPSQTWQHHAINALTSRYDASTLDGFLPPAFGIEWKRSRGLGDGEIAGSAEEIAESLVVLHDTDLLANATELRHRISNDLGIARLERFHPGSAGARAFVRRAELPGELAGVPEAERPQSIVQLRSYRRLPELVDYQLAGRQAMTVLFREHDTGIYSVPTGGGKTRTAWEAVYDILAQPSDGPRNLIVWLAHRNELLDQACACLEDVWRSRDGDAAALLIRLWGRDTREALTRLNDVDLPERDAVVIVSTPATMAAVVGESDRAPRLREAIVARTRAVVVDEAHRAAAPSYRSIIDTLLGGDNGAPVALLGLTATPFRATTSASAGTEETEELKEIFGRLMVPAELGRDPQRTLVKRGILARPVFEDLATGIVLDLEDRVRRLLRKSGRLSAGQEELIDRWLAAQVLASSHSPERHARVLQIVHARAQDPSARVLYFGHSVANAQLMACALLRAGVPAAVVSGATRPWTRRRLIDEFRAGRIRVLCNCEVLTTGFDAPLVTHVVVARPTVSIVLYEQMIGRGLRGPKFGGTDTCHIVNCIDRVRMGPLKLAHLRFRELWESGSDKD